MNKLTRKQVNILVSEVVQLQQEVSWETTNHQASQLLYFKKLNTLQDLIATFIDEQINAHGVKLSKNLFSDKFEEGNG